MAGRELKQNSLIIHELQQGKELARKLQIHLSTSSSASDQTREWLAQKILDSYETALSFLGTNHQSTCEFMHPPPATMSESPPTSLSGSPGSQELLDRDQFKDQDPTMIKKRKCLNKWTKQVQASAGNDFEGPLDDGYSWRKYGQKDILGAKYPRGYYRCSHRNVQNCLATKHVQRSDEDPTIFHITYCGIHTCDQHNNSNISLLSPKQALMKDYAGKPTDHHHPREEEVEEEEASLHHILQHQQSFPQEEVFLDFKTAGLRVLSTHQDSSIIFNAPAAASHHPHELFLPSATLSPSTMAGARTTTSIYCTTTTTSCPAFGNLNYNKDHNPRTSYLYDNCSVPGGSSESELTQIISAAATSSAVAPPGFDPFGNHIVGSDPSFTFDNHWRSL